MKKITNIADLEKFVADFSKSLEDACADALRECAKLRKEQREILSYGSAELGRLQKEIDQLRAGTNEALKKQWPPTENTGGGDSLRKKALPAPTHSSERVH